MRTAPLALLALALAGCGDPLFFADVEDRQICLQLPTETIQGTGVNLGTQQFEFKWENDFDLGSQVPGLGDSGTTGSIHVLALDVNSSTDLGLIDHAEVDVSDASGQLEPFMDYAKGSAGSMTFDAASGTYDLSMAMAKDLDIFARLEGGRVHYAITFAMNGVPPTSSWTASVTTCFNAKVKIDFLQAAKH